MKDNKEMSSPIYRIAVFPLNIIVLPGEEVPLRIFEPRYKQLINECDQTGKPFAIPYLNKGIVTSFGSQVELVSIDGKHENGNMVITIRGESLFKTLDIIDELPGKLYGGGMVQTLDDDFGTTNAELIVLAKRMNLNLDLHNGALPTRQDFNMLDIARELRFTSEQKYRFLSLTTSKQREAFLLGQLRFVDFIQKQEKKLDKNYQLN